MKNVRKSMSVILILLIALFSFSTVAFASTTEQDGLKVELKTDKENYSLNEDIKINVTVSNTNDVAVKNVKIDTLLPEGLTLKNKGKSTSSEAVSIPAGEKIKFSVVAVVKDSNTETSSQDNSKVQSPVDKNNNGNGTANNGTTNTNKENDKSPYTGGDYAVMTGLGALFCIGIVFLILCLKRYRKKTTKVISSVLCVVLAVSSLVGLFDFKASAENSKSDNNSSVTDTNDNTTSSIDLSEKIVVNNKEYTIYSNIYYYIFDEFDSEDFEKYEDLCTKIDKIEASFLDLDGYVPDEQVNNAIMSVAELASSLKKEKEILQYKINYYEEKPVSVWIKMFSGMEVVYTPKQKNILSSDTSFAPNISSMTIYLPSLFDFDSSLQDDIRNKYYKFYEDVTSLEFPLCSKAGIFENNNVTFSSLLKLKANQLIMWFGHGVWHNNHTYLEIGEKYNKATYNKNKALKEMWNNGKIIATANRLIAVNYQYLDETLNDLTNSMIYINSCWSGCDKDLCEIFIKKGIGGLVVNSGSIQAGYGCAMQYTTIGLMTKINKKTNDYYTLPEALNYCKKELGTSDLNKVYPFVYHGTDYRILSAVNNTLYGRVKEAENKNPISNLEVRIYNSNYALVNKTTTDENGGFSFSLSAGNYILQVGGEGDIANDYSYWQSETKIAIKSGGVSTVLLDDILLNRIETGIEGYVYDNDDLINNGKNTPISDVTIEIYNNTTSDLVGTCKTNENGKYSIAVDKNGSYNLVFKKTGYMNETKDMVFVNGGFNKVNAYLSKGGNGGVTEIIWEGSKYLGCWDRDVELKVAGIPLAEKDGIVTLYYEAEGPAQISVINKVGLAWIWTPLVGANGNDYFDTQGGKLQIKLTAEQAKQFATSNAIFLKGQNAVVTKMTYTAPGYEIGIKGYVYDNDDLINNGKNIPISNVIVEVYNNTTLNLVDTCKTDENGKYSIAVDKNGSYNLVFKKIGYKNETKDMVLVNGGFTNVSAYLIKDGKGETIWKGSEYLDNCGKWGKVFELGVSGIPLAEKDGIVTLYYEAEGPTQITVINKVGSEWIWTPLVDANGNDYFDTQGGKLQIKLTAEQAKQFATSNAIFLKGENVVVTMITYTAPVQ